jgi:hypothetical protein
MATIKGKANTATLVSLEYIMIYLKKLEGSKTIEQKLFKTFKTISGEKQITQKNL